MLTVKGNQPTLHAEIQKYFEDAEEKDYDLPRLQRLKKTENGYGRIERREFYVMPAPKSLRDTGDWADLDNKNLPHLVESKAKEIASVSLLAI